MFCFLDYCLMILGIIFYIVYLLTIQKFSYNYFDNYESEVSLWLVLFKKTMVLS